MFLVTWIAVMKYLLLYLYLYVNDSFSAQKRGEMLFYKGYQKQLPSHLTRLLQLWDFIGLPHEEQSKLQLITAVRDFALHGTRRVLRDF